MEISKELRSLKEPKKMLFLGILLLGIGAFLFAGLGRGNGIAAENGVTSEAAFDESTENIDDNMVFGRYIGCVAMAVGAVFCVTVLISLLWDGLHKISNNPIDEDVKKLYTRSDARIRDSIRQ